MATSLKLRTKSVLFLVVLSMVVMSSEARVLPQLSPMGRKANSEFLLRELINKMQNSERSHKKRSMLGSRLERVSPEGPDSQHHH